MSHAKGSWCNDDPYINEFVNNAHPINQTVMHRTKIRSIACMAHHELFSRKYTVPNYTYSPVSFMFYHFYKLLNCRLIKEKQTEITTY